MPDCLYGWCIVLWCNMPRLTACMGGVQFCDAICHAWLPVWVVYSSMMQYATPDCLYGWCSSVMQYAMPDCLTACMGGVQFCDAICHAWLPVWVVYSSVMQYATPDCLYGWCTVLWCNMPPWLPVWVVYGSVMQYATPDCLTACMGGVQFCDAICHAWLPAT